MPDIREIIEAAAQHTADGPASLEKINAAMNAKDPGWEFCEILNQVVAQLVPLVVEKATRRPRVWFDGDTVPAGVQVMAEDGTVHPDPLMDPDDEEWTNRTGPVVEIVLDYDAEVARARRERNEAD